VDGIHQAFYTYYTYYTSINNYITLNQESHKYNLFESYNYNLFDMRKIKNIN